MIKDKNLKTIRNILTTNLVIKKSETLLVFTDDADKRIRTIAKRIAKEGRYYAGKVKYTEYTATGSHGAEPPEHLWNTVFGKSTIQRLESEKLLKPILEKTATRAQIMKARHIVRACRKETVNAVIALAYYSTSHTQFRHFLTEICGTRYASMPLFDEKMLEGAMNVDWASMEKRTRAIARKIKNGENVEIHTPNGTHITFSIMGRKASADTGILVKRGAFSNLPAGEVYVAPVEGTAHGKLVLEWAPTRKLEKPLTLHVRKGKVRRITGKDSYAGHLKRKLSERRENANIAELGIGTNDGASRPDNILESEKILGTVHIALGDNSAFGGNVSTPFHQDFVFFEPTVTMTDKHGRERCLIDGGNVILQPPARRERKGNIWRK